MFSILVAVLEVTGKNGEVVKVGRSFVPVVAFAPFVVTFLLFALVISYSFFKKRLEHKQIMAAIEKGVPLSELKSAKPAGPAWIKSLTAGIALLIIAVGLVCMWLVQGYASPPPLNFLLIAVVLLGIGLAFFIRGLLLRKSQR